MSSTLANARSTIPNDCKAAGDCGEFEVTELVERRGWASSGKPKIPCVCLIMFMSCVIALVVQRNG